MSIDSTVAGFSLLTAGEALHSWSSFMPSAFTANNWVLDGSDGEIADKVVMWRKGYRPALAISLGLGLGVSLISRSAVPFLAALIADVLMAVTYEHILPAQYRLNLSDWPAFLVTGQSPLPGLPAASTPAIASPNDRGTGL